MNAVPYGFKTCAVELVDSRLHPFDAIVIAYIGDSAKEAKDAAFGAVDDKGKFEKADVLLAGAKALNADLKKLLEWAKANVDDTKKNFGEKYNKAAVEKDIDGTLKLISEAYPAEESLKWPEAAPAGGDAAGDKEKTGEGAGAEGEAEKEGG